MESYQSSSEAINALKAKGYTIDFNNKYDCIVCHKTALALAPDEFEIVEVHRFEGDTNPDDEEVVYAIESKHGEKGTLLNAYGMYADSLSEDMIRKLHIKH
jgi:hypothetical protein